ncbi:MAG: hypothetical protein ACLFSB_03785 [Chitinispirillaceae bacterium]
MRRIHAMNKPFEALGGSTTDGNRLYSILLDARASTMSENMYDISEKLLSSEKENAKVVLEQLWSLKKNMPEETGSSTVDMLIQFYQEKMDLLRNKEEYIKKISSDSRTMLEEKRKRDAEIATVKQEIGECSEEIARLNTKLEKLKVKEQELSLIETQVNEELSRNGNEVINGLYEIILPRKCFGGEPDEDGDEENGAEENGAEISQERIPKKDEHERSSDDTRREIRSSEEHAMEEASEVRTKNSEKAQEKISLPKSVVKTTKGRVIAEYFYDQSVYKNQRHYVYNSMFFGEQLTFLTRTLQKNFDRDIYAEALQLVQDALKRISENKSLHFAVATNEILNENALKEVNHNLRTRAYEEVVAFCNRLTAKIDAMGNNFALLISEQMQRYKS